MKMHVSYQRLLREAAQAAHHAYHATSGEWTSPGKRRQMSSAVFAPSRSLRPVFLIFYLARINSPIEAIRRSSSWRTKVVSDANLARFTWHVPSTLSSLVNPAIPVITLSQSLSPLLARRSPHHPAAHTVESPLRLVRCLADRAELVCSSFLVPVYISSLSFLSIVYTMSL